MGKFFNAVKAGVRGAVGAMGPSRFQSASRVVACTHCQGEIFERREAQLNTAGMSFLDLDWMNSSGVALICTNCGLIQWFGMEPIRLDP